MSSHGIPFIAELLTRLTPRLGAQLYLEPEQKRVGFIQFRNGRRCFFRDNRFDLNTLGAVNIARDKSYCSILLKHFGYPVPDELTFWQEGKFLGSPIRRSVTDAINFAEEAGFPVVLKPVDRSQGQAVSLAYNMRELRSAAQSVFAMSNVAIVQRFCAGKDYRLVVLDGEIISAYLRIPLTVRGDGESTIRQLLALKQIAFTHCGRDTTLRIVPAMRRRLKRLGLTLESRPCAGRVIRLLDTANLSLGGESRDITATVHRSHARLVCDVARDLNLRFCGIDLIVRDIGQPDASRVVLEVNASPGLDHYALTKKERQESVVDDLYLRVLRRIEVGPRS